MEAAVVMDDSKLKLLILGLAAGDSLGSTSEFCQRAKVPALYMKIKSKGWPFCQIGGGAFGWKPGEATDDTDMAMGIVRSFKRRGGFDAGDAADEFIKWLDTSPPDVGNATRKGLSAVRAGTSWHEGGLKDFLDNPRSAANGSLMRNGVVPGMAPSLNEAFRISLYQSLPTHYGPLPVLCCCAQTYLIWELLSGRDPLAGDWPSTFRQSFSEWWATRADDTVIRNWWNHVGIEMAEAWSAFLAADWNPDSFEPFTLAFKGADGYCLLTLQIAVWASHWSRRGVAFPTPVGFPSEVFERAVGPLFLSAVAMIGHDSDTYGAVAGPLIAAIHGAVPDCLTDGLEVLNELAGLGPP